MLVMIPLSVLPFLTVQWRRMPIPIARKQKDANRDQRMTLVYEESNLLSSSGTTSAEATAEEEEARDVCVRKGGGGKRGHGRCQKRP